MARFPRRISRGPLAGRTFESRRDYRNALARAQGFSSEKRARTAREKLQKRMGMTSREARNALLFRTKHNLNRQMRRAQKLYQQGKTDQASRVFRNVLNRLQEQGVEVDKAAQGALFYH